MTKTKVLVIGLDGATWNLIKPWADEGKLPTIKRLMSAGSWGELESSIPFLTSPAWKCYSTGKNPGKLGVFGFLNLDRKSKQIILKTTSTSFKGKEIWDYLGERGVRCGIINMPLTYPPKQVNGFMVSGFPAFDWSNYTHPRELKQKLVKLYNYMIEPQHQFLAARGLSKDKAISESMELIKNQFRVAKSLLKSEEIDFLHLTIFTIDTMQHFLWHDMETNNQRYGKVIEKCWAMIDFEIRELLDQVDNETYTFLMSDHGFTKVKAVFYLNRWLNDKGYLHLKNSNSFSLLARAGLTQDRIIRLVKYARLDNIIRFLFPAEKVSSIRRQFPYSEGERTIISIMKSVNWDKTKAITVGEACIYINLPKSSSKYEEIREKLINELKRIVDPTTREVIFRDVRRREDVYDGEFLPIAPDLLVIPNDGYRPVSSMKNKHFWNHSKENRWSGCHKPHGIFIAHGPNIRKGIEVGNARICDVAPTILYLYGLPIPPDMDGRVLEDIFEEEYLKEHPIRALAKEEIRMTKKECLSGKDEEEIKERLRKLGYL
ncbi:MAG: alkaline phosphatase family protein [Candidatus Heimdallarchaeota archaeon]